MSRSMRAFTHTRSHTHARIHTLYQMDAAAEREAWANYDPTSSKSIEDVMLPGQRYCVFQLAHQHTSIRSRDGNPWMRCVGFSSTLDEARTLARSSYETTRGETRIMPVARNFLASKSMYTRDNIDQQQTDQDRSNAFVDSWIESRKQAFEDVKRRSLETPETVTPETGTEVAEVISDTVISDTVISDTPEAMETILPNVGKLQPPVNQVFWAAAVIPNGDEPSVIPLFATASEQDMRKFVDIASRCKDLVHFPIHVAPTCVWMPLLGIKSPETIHKHPLRQQLESRLSWTV